MKPTRTRAKGQQKNGRFALMPQNVLMSAECHAVSGEALRLLMALAAQYNGHNNGDLTAASSVMRCYGFTSEGTITRALKQLLAQRLIIRSRESMCFGGRGTCALYALAWQGIDPCPGKHLNVNPCPVASMQFRPATIKKTALKRGGRGTDNGSGSELNASGEALKTGVKLSKWRISTAP